MTAICAALRLARRTAYYVTRAHPNGRYHRAADATVLQQIRAVTNSRATYGYRRVWAMVNRTFRTAYNRKRIRRVMQLHGLMLPPRVHRRHGRPHLGQIQQAASNQRWCSDVFLIPCWSGEVLSVAFAIDCHDREVPAYVASPRSLTGADIRTQGEGSLTRMPHKKQEPRVESPPGARQRTQQCVNRVPSRWGPCPSPGAAAVEAAVLHGELPFGNVRVPVAVVAGGDDGGGQEAVSDGERGTRTAILSSMSRRYSMDARAARRGTTELPNLSGRRTDGSHLVSFGGWR